MSVVNRTTNGVVTIGDVKTTKKVYRLWKNGAAGKEYFLVENRQRKLYDQKLPGEGLLVYHVDESLDSNEDENHPFIKLLEADAKAPARRRESRRRGRSLPGEREERLADGRVQSELEIVRRQRHVCDDHQYWPERGQHEGPNRRQRTCHQARQRRRETKKAKKAQESERRQPRPRGPAGARLEPRHTRIE